MVLSRHGFYLYRLYGTGIKKLPINVHFNKLFHEIISANSKPRNAKKNQKANMNGQKRESGDGFPYLKAK